MCTDIESVEGADIQNLPTLALLRDFLSQDVVSFAIRSLRSSDAYERTLAAEVLALLGDRAAPAVSKLITLLADPSKEVRLAVLNALGRIGLPAISALDSLFALVHDNDRQIAVAANDAIAAIRISGHMADLHLSVESRWFGNPAPDTKRRVHLAEFSSLCVPKPLEAIATLVFMLKKDPSPEVKKRAAESLGDFRDAAKVAVPALIDTIKVGLDLAPKVAAMFALAKIGDTSAEVIEAIEADLRGQCESVQAEIRPVFELLKSPVEH